MTDDGEVDSPCSGSGLLDLHSDDYSYLLDDASNIIDSDWEAFIGTQICSHKHICNPTTGPDNTHTHICEHTHTQTIGSGDGEEVLTKKRRPSGNKEAVRKYREKQKAVKVNLEVRNAELERENRRIPDLLKENLWLRRKLQERGPKRDAVQILIADNKRLRALLAEHRRQIELELDGGVGRSDPSSGIYLPSTCAAPVPCLLPARHVAAAGARQKGVVDVAAARNLDALGWHAECETRDTTTFCYTYEPDNQRGSASDSRYVSTEQVVETAKAATAARRPPVDSVLHTLPMAYHRGEVPCAAPAPCLNGRAAGPSTVFRPQHNCNSVQSWKEGCEKLATVTCGDADLEVTANSCPHSPSLGPAGHVVQSAAATTLPETSTPKLVAADIFSSGCYYPDQPPPRSPPCWNNQHYPSTGVCAGWLEQNDSIDGAM